MNEGWKLAPRHGFTPMPSSQQSHRVGTLRHIFFYWKEGEQEPCPLSATSPCPNAPRPGHGVAGGVAVPGSRPLQGSPSPQPRSGLSSRRPRGRDGPRTCHRAETRARHAFCRQLSYLVNSNSPSDGSWGAGSAGIGRGATRVFPSSERGGAGRGGLSAATPAQACGWCAGHSQAPCRHPARSVTVPDPGNTHHESLLTPAARGSGPRGAPCAHQGTSGGQRRHALAGPRGWAR